MSTQNTILIVEDEHDLQDALASALGYEDFTIIQAYDGEEGLQKAKDESPALILLDISLPKIDGLEVLRTLKKTEWGKDIKVIIMTALDDFEKMAEVMDAGGDEYVVKTQISLSDLVQKINAKLGK
ncbi:MAG TPA: response regulator [Candidatus Paceibacterota bacterium]|nr:response regulator [Candidatus Paceibacterota bacterium]